MTQPKHLKARVRYLPNNGWIRGGRGGFGATFWTGPYRTIDDALEKASFWDCCPDPVMPEGASE